MEREWWRTSWFGGGGWFLATASGALFILIVGDAIADDYPLDSREVREWTSALSGWAAAIAAGITLRYLERQTHLAERLRQEDARRQILRRQRVLNGLTSAVYEIATEAMEARFNGPRRGNPPAYRRLTPVATEVIDSDYLDVEIAQMARGLNLIVRRYNGVLDDQGRLHEFEQNADDIRRESQAIIRRCSREFVAIQRAVD